MSPIICDYTKRKDLDAAFKRSGAKLAFIITDYFLAARCSQSLEIAQGKKMIDACKAAGCNFVVYSSAADAERYNAKVKHIKGKVEIENYLKSSGINHTILRPCAL